MKSIKNYISASMRFLLLLLFAGYYCSISMFYHPHLVNGHIIYHSHPFKNDSGNKSPFQSHNHTPTAYNIIHHLNKPYWEKTPSPALIPEPLVVNSNQIRQNVIEGISYTYYFFSRFRGPPLS